MLMTARLAIPRVLVPRAPGVLSALGMLAADKDVVGGLYPKKSLPIEYVINLKRGGKTEGPLFEVDTMGTGFLMFKRHVYQRLIDAHPETKYVDDIGLGKQYEPWLYAIYDTAIDERGHYLSEDWTFCRRWQALGGEIWADSRALLNHCGLYQFKSDVAALERVRVTLVVVLADDSVALLLLEQVRSRERDRQRIARLSAVLEIAAQWQQTQEMDVLLSRMAEASTKLLHAQRASIFLWDRTTHTLVGRPALGVEGGELRVPDDAGIVGQVIQTGQARRVDADFKDEQRDIDRRVDQRLKFQTRSLICVPLRGRSGELFGAFEVLNKIDGNFSADDEQALAELAEHTEVEAGIAQFQSQQLSGSQGALLLPSPLRTGRAPLNASGSSKPYVVRRSIPATERWLLWWICW
jgi:putative methionine-R-sulfoxide reductase with GAF domain